MTGRGRGRDHAAAVALSSVATKIDVELTSAREDGTWTWRAAGAREPKGALEASVLYDGAKVGDVVRAEADFGIDGINIVSVRPAREPKPEPERLALRPEPSRDAGVTVSLARGRRPEPGARPGRRGNGEGTRTTRESGPPGGTRGIRSRPGRGPRDTIGQRPEERARHRPAGNGPAPERSSEGATSRRHGDKTRGPHGPAPAAGDARRRGGQGAGSPRPGSTRDGVPRRRLVVGSTHRDMALAGIPTEHRPIAEQALRGGLPALRQAIAAQNAEARAEGRPEVQAEPLMAIAEELLPKLKAAAWRDSAEAVAEAGDAAPLRELRAVVLRSDSAARDAETRLLAAKLRERLEERVKQMRERWMAEITAGLDAGKPLRALRASSRAPDPAAKLPAELALRLSHAAGEAMAPSTPPERWSALLEAATASPVRRSVHPAGLPAEPGDKLLAAAKHASGRVPALAALLGIPMPPPPGPPRPAPARSSPARRPRRPGEGANVDMGHPGRSHPQPSTP